MALAKQDWRDGGGAVGGCPSHQAEQQHDRACHASLRCQRPCRRTRELVKR
jgi:hypothetical protein